MQIATGPRPCDIEGTCESYVPKDDSCPHRSDCAQVETPQFTEPQVLPQTGPNPLLAILALYLGYLAVRRLLK